MQLQEIIEIFNSGFAPVSEKFVHIDVGVVDAPNAEQNQVNRVVNVDHIWKPGVYVFWHPQRGVIRVGRSLDNSRKRALQHISSNTGGTMSCLASDPQARLILFNVKDPMDNFWVAALEIYLERELNPEIASGRQG